MAYKSTYMFINEYQYDMNAKCFTEGLYKNNHQGTPMLRFCNSHPELNDSAGCEAAMQDARRSQSFGLYGFVLFKFHAYNRNN